MIKLLRDAAHNYPWFLKSIMMVLAVAFIITMGWWGFGQQTGNIVAAVGDLTITQDEFRRAFESTYRLYKESNQGDVKDEMLKEFVLQQLIDHRLWIVAANQMGLRVSDADLRNAIMQRPEFHRNGVFDPEQYRRLLAANRLTPALFESMEAKDMLGNKARAFVMEAVALTPAEISEAQALVARQGEGDKSTPRDQVVQSFLFQKQQRALAAYSQSLKTQIPIQIHKELL